VETVWAILTAVIGVIGSIWILYRVRNLDRYRSNEDEARAFFDENGHWPDETREEAEAERARILAAGTVAPPPLSTPSQDGFV
jgi:hypothetical protein